MVQPIHVALTLGLVAATSSWAAGAEPDATLADEATLRAAGLPTNGPGVADFVRKQAMSEDDRSAAPKLIRKLGDDDFDVREQATAELKTMGPGVRPMLRQAMSDPDPEVRFRAMRCLASIESSARPASLGAALRTLARLKPPGAVEAILTSLPSLEDAAVVDEACRALAALAVRMGKVDAALVQALGDALPVRRAVAGDALTRAAVADLRPAVAKLLQDPDLSVRQRVSLALFDARDKDSIPALIALLGEAPRERTVEVEEALRVVAGDQAPNVSPGDDEASRRACRDAWEDWWKEHGPALDLTKIDPSTRRLGYTLVAEMEKTTTNSRLVEYDAGGKERWQMTGLRYAIDAQMIGPDRVLVAEHTNRLITERNLKGEILWTYHANGLLLGARRLDNGDTFVVTRNQLAVVDRDAKETVTIQRPNDVCAAAKFRDGSIALLTNGGLVVHLDEKGKELKSLPLNAPVLTVGTNIDALPNGHVLVPLFSTNKVVEIDEGGKTVWEATTQHPSSVARLASGHTLVGDRMGQTIVELDDKGKEVRSIKTEGRPFRATQR
jgi:hypothetical protein